MNFIIEEELTLDIENPAIFAQDINGNLSTIINKNFINKFISNKFYSKIIEIVSISEIFVQNNNSGCGSITAIVKFLCILYTPESLVFNLNINSVEVIQNNNLHKCSSDKYKYINFLVPSNTTKYTDVIKCGKIITLSISKSSQNIIIVEPVEKIYPILLPYDFTKELEKSKYNKHFIEKLMDDNFNNLFEDIKKNNGDTFAYIKGEIIKTDNDIPSFKDLRNIKDKQHCYEMLENIIYNFINF